MRLFWASAVKRSIQLSFHQHLRDWRRPKLRTASAFIRISFRVRATVSAVRLDAPLQESNDALESDFRVLFSNSIKYIIAFRSVISVPPRYVSKFQRSREVQTGSPDYVFWPS